MNQGPRVGGQSSVKGMKAVLGRGGPGQGGSHVGRALENEWRSFYCTRGTTVEEGVIAARMNGLCQDVRPSTLMPGMWQMCNGRSLND